MSDSGIEDFDWEDDFEWLDAEIAEELEASKSTENDSKDNRSEPNHHSSGPKRDVSAVDKKSLFKFISALQQMEYNFYGKLAKSCDYAFIKERVESNSQTARLIANHLGYKENSLSDMYYFNILLRQVAFIETSAREGGASFNELMNENGEEFLKGLMSINTDGAIYLEDELSSNDISLHIKSALLPYALYYEAFIQKTTNKNRGDLEKFVFMIVSMAKDISTRWQKNNTVLDKALTFTTSLPIVSRFCMQYVETYLSTEIQNRLSGYKFIGKDIYSAIEVNDAGYGDYPQLKTYLFEKVNSAIEGLIDSYISTSWRQDILFPKEQIKLIISEKAYDLWLECCKQEVIDFKRLNEKEKVDYLKKHNNVMDISIFLDSLVTLSNGIINDIFCVNIEWKVVESGVRDKFSMYWGVSDAIYKRN